MKYFFNSPTMGLLKKYRTTNSPPVEGWQVQPDGVVASCLYRSISLTTGKGRIKLPIEPVGQSAFSIIRPQYIVLAYNIVCHLIHGNDSCGAWRLRLGRHNALGRICISAPTAYEILFQQPRVSVLVISPQQEGNCFVQEQSVRADISNCRLTFGRIYKSTPTTQSVVLFCSYGLTMMASAIA